MAFIDFETCSEGFRPGELIVISTPTGYVSHFLTDVRELELLTLALYCGADVSPDPAERCCIVNDREPPHPTDPHRPRAHHPRSPKRSRR